VGNLGKMSHTRVVETEEERFEKTRTCLALRLHRGAAHAYPGLHKGAHEPRPDGALVIRAVALPDTSLVARYVAGLIGRERAEAERRHQPCLHGVDHTPSSHPLDDSERKTTDRQDLVRAKRRIAGAPLVAHIDDVVERPRRLVPETVLEGCATSCEDFRPALGEGAPDAERIQPERLDLDRLPDPRRDDPRADLRVHPGELDTLLARREEAIVVGMDAVSRASTVAREDRIDRRLERPAISLGDALGELKEVVD